MSRVISSRRIATIAIFATIYAILDQIPVSKLIGVSSTLTLAEIFSPLAGLILGPFAGAASVLIGTFGAVLLGRPLVFDGLDFIPAVAAALTAGFAIKRPLSAATFSVALAAIFYLDPFSLPLIGVDGVPVPYYWMQLVALFVFVLIAYVGKADFSPGGSTLLSRRSIFSSANLPIIAVVFLSTMNAEVAGGIMYENVFVLTGVMSAGAVIGFWPVIFYVYPIERIFFTLAGSLLALPVLRVLPQSMLEILRGTFREQRRSPVPSP